MPRPYRVTTKGGRQLFLHRVLWTQERGPIPARHILHHLDGDPGNNCLSNLVCMSYSEHLRLHRGHVFSADGLQLPPAPPHRERIVRIPQNVETGDILSAADAATILGITRGGVSQAVKRGDLERVFLPGENKRTSRNCYLLRADVLEWGKQRKAAK